MFNQFPLFKIHRAATHRRTVFLIAAIVFFALCGSSFSVNAQICQPPSVDYIVRDKKGKIIDPKLLESPKLNENGAAKIKLKSGESIDLSTRTVKYQNQESPALHIFQGGCTLYFDELVLQHHGKKMRLIFDLELIDTNSKIIDSVPFRAGTYKLDLKTLKWEKAVNEP